MLLLKQYQAGLLIVEVHMLEPADLSPVTELPTPQGEGQHGQ